MIIVLTAYPDMKKAEEAAERIVEKELAACVSIIKSERSIYKWNGKVERAGEHVLIIKTTKKAYPHLEALIKKGHPYELPEIIYFSVEGGSKDYLSWVDSSVLSRLLSVPLDLRLTRRAGEPPKEETRARKPSTLS